MKIPSLLIFSALLFGTCSLSAANESSTPRDAEIVPAKGEYVVLMSEATAKRNDWKAAADKFLQRYTGTLVLWNGDDVNSAHAALKKAQPRYVAVIAAPEEIDRVLIAKLYHISRSMNDDIYGDFLWGVITGKDAATAASLLAKDTPLVLDRAIGTTNFDQRRFKKSFFITDWKAREYVETEKFVASDKKDAKPGQEMVEMFAERWKDIRPQFVISSSHATEYNLEMPFGEGLLASAETEFYLVQKPLLHKFIGMLGNEAAFPAFAKSNKLKTLAKTPDEKIWIAAGNCLFGDVLKTPKSMAVTAISAANVKQLVGYTIPSWFGEGGWGTSDKFFNGHQAMSVGQAWFFNNQILLKSLPEGAVNLDVPLNPNGMSGIDTSALTAALKAKKINVTRETLGRVHDRDVVAFYGDPLFRARFNPNAVATSPWVCKVVENKNAQVFTITPFGKNAHKGDFCLWFPKRLAANKKPTIKMANGSTPEPDILTENFVIFRGLALGAGETLTLTVPTK